MLSKLLKYDLKWNFKPLLVFYMLILFFSIIIRVVESFNQSLILLVIDKVCSGILITLIINIIINCIMRNWGRFNRNVYKDEAYLTHTIPVSKSKIYLSKILSVIITIFISLIIIIVSLVIASLTKESSLFLKEVLEMHAINFNVSVVGLVFIIFALVFLELLFIVLCGIVGIILGNRSNDLKIVKSILYGFLIYIVLSILIIGIIYVMGLFNSDIMSLFRITDVSYGILKSLMFFGIIIYFIYNLLLYFVGNKLLNKGVNVD